MRTGLVIIAALATGLTIASHVFHQEPIVPAPLPDFGKGARTVQIDPEHVQVTLPDGRQGVFMRSEHPEQPWGTQVPLIPWWALGVLLFGLYAISGFVIVDQWDRRPVLHLGKYERILDPGMSWVEPFTHTLLEDWTVRDIVVKMSIDHIQTHDNIPISFVMIVTQRVIDVQKAEFGAEDSWEASQDRAVAVATEYVGNAELDSILHERDGLNDLMKRKLQKLIEPWGIEVIAIELQNIKITDENIQSAISMKARAQKEGEAELVRASMQGKIAEALKEAAQHYDAASWKLKEMETVLEMTRSAHNNTVLIPTDLIGAIARMSGKA